MRARIATALVCVLLTTAAAVPAASMGQSSEGYAGAHVSFEASGSALTEYAVANETMLSEVRVQSQESAKGSGLVDVGASLSAMTHLDGSALGLESQAEASAEVRAESGATLTAHDNGHGVLVVASGDESQYVTANVSDGGSAKAEGDSRVVVTTESGQQGTFVVVGNGSVTVNDEGDVSAALGEDGRLVFRAYPEERSDDDETQERLVADGKAAAEVYVMQQGGETVTDTVSYAGDTTVEAKQSAEGQVEVTVDRATHEGTVVITSVSEEAVGSLDDLSVTVDGEAAVEASSYSEVQSAIGGDESKFMVAQQSSAEASADVLVGVNHFSERTMTIDGGESSSGDSTTSDGSGDGSSSDGGDGGTTASDGQPGFGAAVALASLVAAALVAVRRR